MKQLNHRLPPKESDQTDLGAPPHYKLPQEHFSEDFVLVCSINRVQCLLAQALQVSFFHQSGSSLPVELLNQLFGSVFCAIEGTHLVI